MLFDTGKNSTCCRHQNVVVDYDHPHGTITGAFVERLRMSDVQQTRTKMVLRNATCHDCGAMLSPKVLKNRIAAGGDLYDERFGWA